MIRKVFREGDGGFKQIAVNGQGEGAALKLSEAAGNGQPQTAALGGTELSPRTKRSIKTSAEIFRGSREIFLTERSA